MFSFRGGITWADLAVASIDSACTSTVGRELPVPDLLDCSYLAIAGLTGTSLIQNTSPTAISKLTVKGTGT